MRFSKILGFTCLSAMTLATLGSAQGPPNVAFARGGLSGTSIADFTVSPDNVRFAVADSSIKVFNFASTATHFDARLERTFLIPAGGTNPFVAFSPNGARMGMSWAEGGTTQVRVFDTSNWSVVTNTSYTGTGTRMFFSPNGSLVSSGTRSIDVANGTVTAITPTIVGWRATGNPLVNNGGSVNEWSLATNTQVTNYNSSANGAASPDGRFWAFPAAGAGRIAVRDLTNGGATTVGAANNQSTNGRIAWLGDSARFITYGAADADGMRIATFNGATWSLSTAYTGLGSPLPRPAFAGLVTLPVAGTDVTFLTAMDEVRMTTLSGTTYTERNVVSTGVYNNGAAVRFTPNGVTQTSVMYGSTRAPRLRNWDQDGGVLAANWATDPNTNGLAISGDGTQVALSFNGSATIQVRNRTTGVSAGTITAPANVSAIDGNGGRLLVSAGTNVVSYNLTAGAAALATVATGVTNNPIAVSADGSLALVGSFPTEFGTTAALVSLPSLTVVKAFPVAATSEVKISLSGTKVALRSGNTVTVRDVVGNGSTTINTLGGPTAMELSSDGGAIALAENGAGLTLRSTLDGTLINLFDQEVGPGIGSINIHPSGRRMAYVRTDGSIILFRLPVSSLTSIVTTTPTMVGGNAARGHVYLGWNANANTVVNTSSDSADLAMPTSVTVTAGTNRATWSATTNGVDAQQTVTLTASLLGASRTASVTLNPASLDRLTSTVATATNGTRFTFRALLDGAAGPSGRTVTLSSSHPAIIAVPASLNIGYNAKFASTTLIARTVAESTVVTITATSGDVTKTFDITVNP
jgi:hypothetical protein